ncbi:MAG: HAMP domain-containing sensor histidine kinase [Myxococcota bacterium]
MRAHFHHPHHGRGGPLARYLRAKLRRRLFVWFGATILFTALIVTASTALVGHGAGHGGWHSFERPRLFWLKPPLGLFVGLAVLWGASGFIARRLTRPLAELARVAQEIGRGNLKARMELPVHSGEIGAVGSAVNDMAARIEKQLQDQRELLAAVSHELRTPLSRIRLLTEMARDNGATAQTFNDLDREVMEIDALVGELLASSRVDFAALSLRPLEVKDLVHRALERAGLGPSVLSIEEGAPQQVTADATLLLRALANLIDNARRHGGGLTQLVVSLTDGRVAFEVHDSGPGIAAGEEKLIFEPFHPSARRREGLGLGLSLVKKIALAHGGNAYAKNRPEGGATVGIALPC